MDHSLHFAGLESSTHSNRPEDWILDLVSQHTRSSTSSWLAMTMSVENGVSPALAFLQFLDKIGESWRQLNWFSALCLASVASHRMRKQRACRRFRSATTTHIIVGFGHLTYCRPQFRIFTMMVSPSISYHPFNTCHLTDDSAEIRHGTTPQRRQPLSLSARHINNHFRSRVHHTSGRCTADTLQIN